MPSQFITIASSVGLHARPASLLVKAAGASGLAVTLGRPGEKAVNAASMLMVLSLGVKYNEEVEITVADDQRANEVLASLVEILETNHDEENS
jgi:phosphocarrier protein